MKILITGCAGYLGSRLALYLRQAHPDCTVVGLDNLSRRGAETSLPALAAHGVSLLHGDIRHPSDLRALPPADWVVDCAANPSVLAGLGGFGAGSAEQLVEHNLVGTANVLEYCRQHRAGLVLVSSSRVYSVAALNALPVREEATRLALDPQRVEGVPGLSVEGLDETFSTEPPVSLYGATKLAGEILALEYGQAFDFPVWVNRCGVIAGPGQFGKIDQGVFSFWVYAFLVGRPLRYLGFGGTGKQVRDLVSAEDLARLVALQLHEPGRPVPRRLNVGGGLKSSLSLLETTALCEEFFRREGLVTASREERPFDMPYYVTDNRRVTTHWGWEPSQTGEELLLGLCRWASEHRAFVEAIMKG
ncbi:MAG: NAD-dependent epimerase/dehydratase family protein [Deltaproteobacteria bacterium]|nr:NAD-dependent epimerase/dehydratase family protein [Deltaproteobacteria bacterium]